jgi:NitT/TauT family transport system substrate-binding protein
MNARRIGLKAGLSTLLTVLAFNCVKAAEPDKVTMYLDWTPQVEDAGFFQAQATGIYKAYGLDVTIKPGSPQLNTGLLLLSKQADFIILHSAGELLSAAEKSLPMMAVAAIYQKDPQVIISHKGVGHDDLPSLKGAPFLLSQDAMTSFWPWLKAKYGYTDDQVRPYTFNLGPFIVDPNSVQQAYLTSEPYALKKENIEPNVFLLADNGWLGYASLITARRDADPNLIKRFVQASIEGWYSYWNDHEPAEKLLATLSPDQTPQQMEYSRLSLAKNGILVSQEAKTAGIGAMTAERWKRFYGEMANLGLYKKGLNYQQAFTLNYVNDVSFIDSLKKKYPQADAASTGGVK